MECVVSKAKQLRLRHLSISMWINVHYNKNTFIGLEGLEFLNFAIFEQKHFLIFFAQVKIIKDPAGFKVMTYRFV